MGPKHKHNMDMLVQSNNLTFKKFQNFRLPKFASKYLLVLVVRDNDWQIQSLSLGHYLIIIATYLHYLHPLPPGPVVVPGDVHLVGPQLRHLHVHGAGVGVADLQDYYVISTSIYIISSLSQQGFAPVPLDFRIGINNLNKINCK